MISYKDLGLINSKSLLLQAYENNYAVPAFNFVCTEQLQAIVEACIIEKSSFILQASANVCKYMGIGFVHHLAAAAAEKVNREGKGIRMALNLDHGLSLEECVNCIDHGFSAVMIDGSAKSFQENIDITKQVVEYASKHGVAVEGELGVLSGQEEGQNHSSHNYTDPSAVVEFVQKTGVDCLAVSVGTSHGMVKIKPNPDGSLPELRFDILSEIRNKLSGFPLVLHGSSCIYPEYVEMINSYGGKIETVRGIPEEQVRRAARETSVCKINVASDGWIAATAAVRKALVENPSAIDPRFFLSPAKNEMINLYRKKIQNVMGSGGK